MTQIDAEYLERQAAEFDPEWEAKIIDDTLRGSTGPVEFATIIGVTGNMFWSFIGKHEFVTVEIAGHWSPGSGKFIGAGSILKSEGPALLFGAAGVAPTLWALAYQLATSSEDQESTGSMEA